MSERKRLATPVTASASKTQRRTEDSTFVIHLSSDVVSHTRREYNGDDVTVVAPVAHLTLDDADGIGDTNVLHIHKDAVV